ncbi:cytochrome b5-like heme/steroid binding domain-containing protein [Aspergillus thermomutatus]|uniref:Cytochrome b5 heme-binding domain-containing protein n=1 Tax=Aspergillus thermomutatus TaxID=41047 RepID=A0A397I147_ASPTH|nr:uncharacterized protein CDV56_108757 [Aspergillus thermomutatus]RHZ67154.1 hypothetical protein CDV56_108757 [Aspergillus thermomutatus]
MGVSTEYTWAEVKRHNTPQDLWIAIDGKVYNVSEYQQDHPGGEEILRNFAGQDATTAFTDAGHSRDAYEKLESLLIGSLEPEVSQKKPNSLAFPVN